jgi:hypothetical protein
MQIQAVDMPGFAVAFELRFVQTATPGRPPEVTGGEMGQTCSSVRFRTLVRTYWHCRLVVTIAKSGNQHFSRAALWE